MNTDDETIQVAQNLLTSGNREGAFECMREVLSRNLKHAGANNLAGFIALQKGQPEDAERGFRIATESAPDNNIYRENIAIARGLRQQWTKTEPLRAARGSARCNRAAAGGFARADYT